MGFGTTFGAAVAADWSTAVVRVALLLVVDMLLLLDRESLLLTLRCGWCCGWYTDCRPPAPPALLLLFLLVTAGGCCCCCW